LFSIEDIYTPLPVAKKEIWKRWNNSALQDKVNTFLHNDIPEFLKDKPRSIYWRHLISPNFEFLHFWELSKQIELEPICIEYLSDIFTAKNSCKYHLCKLYFYNGKGRKGGNKISTLKIIDFNAEGKKLTEIETLWRENLVEFHHRMLRAAIDDISIYDSSPWFNYYYHLVLLICHGVLFENFLMNDEEREFTEKIIIPNFLKVRDVFGVQPLIVRLLPPETETDPYWFYYPESIKAKISRTKTKDWQKKRDL
jgi:hypothetical protein